MAGSCLISKNVGITRYLRLLLCIWSLLSSQVLRFKMDKITINVQFNENTCHRVLTVIYYPMNFGILHHIYIPFSTFELVLAISTFIISRSLISHLLDKNNNLAFLSYVSTGKGKYPDAFSFLATIFPLFKTVFIVRSFIA